MLDIEFAKVRAAAWYLTKRVNLTPSPRHGEIESPSERRHIPLKGTAGEHHADTGDGVRAPRPIVIHGP